MTKPKLENIQRVAPKYTHFTGVCSLCHEHITVAKLSDDAKTEAALKHEFEKHVQSRHNKSREDVNQAAFRVVRDATKD